MTARTRRNENCVRGNMDDTREKMRNSHRYVTIGKSERGTRSLDASKNQIMSLFCDAKRR